MRNINGTTTTTVDGKLVNPTSVLCDSHSLSAFRGFPPACCLVSYSAQCRDSFLSVLVVSICPCCKDRVMKQKQRLGDYYILLILVDHLFCVITAETLLTLSQKEKESLPPCDDPPKHVRQSVFFVIFVITRLNKLSDSKSCTMNDKYENFRQSYISQVL